MNLYKDEEMAHFFHQQLKWFKYVNFVTSDLFFSLMRCVRKEKWVSVTKGLMVNSRVYSIEICWSMCLKRFIKNSKITFEWRCLFPCEKWRSFCRFDEVKWMNCRHELAVPFSTCTGDSWDKNKWKKTFWKQHLLNKRIAFLSV